MFPSCRYIDIHTHDDSASDGVLKIICLDCSQEPLVDSRLFCTAIHPWSIEDNSFSMEQDFARVKEKAKRHCFIAIGETGLDRVHRKSLPLQLESFRKHIELSESVSKPLIIHCVRATSDILALHKELQPKQPWIIHGFNGNEQEIKTLCSRNFYLSVGEAILHDDRQIAKLINHLPLDNLFLETDTSKVPIEEIYKRCSALLNIDEDELCKIIQDNFSRCFHYYNSK